MTISSFCAFHSSLTSKYGYTDHDIHFVFTEMYDIPSELILVTLRPI